MLGILKKVTPMLFVIAFALTNSAFSNINFGGEIPWPLSIQHAVTVKNSKGLWTMKTGKTKRMFNVEMRKDSRSGFDWIRVSELHPKSLKVIFWGEGVFNSDDTDLLPQSSFSSVGLETDSGKADSRGRYIHMFSNGNFETHPYLIRMVEVESALGNVLGLSIINYEDKKFEHMLGTRTLKRPLSCFENKDEKLTCYLGGH